MRAIAVSTLLTAAALLTVSCGTQPQCESTAYCGELQACLEGTCVDVDCIASTDCALENFCDQTTFTCAPGCATSTDCLIGDRCDALTAQCVRKSCTDTQVDCDFLERCDPDTKTCQPDPDPHCQECRGPNQCGPTGRCSSARDGRAYCELECSPESADPCPVGLQCTAQYSGPGGDIEFRCAGLCNPN